MSSTVIYMTPEYLIGFAIAYLLLLIPAVLILVKFYKQLGPWSKIIVVWIMLINLGQVIQNMNLANYNPDEKVKILIDTQSSYWFFYVFYTVFAVFTFNIVAVKIYFIQMILDASSPNECDIIKNQVQTRIKTINLAFAILLAVGLIMRTFYDLEDYNIVLSWILTVFTVCSFIVYAYFFVKFLKAAKNVIPNYQK